MGSIARRMEGPYRSAAGLVMAARAGCRRPARTHARLGTSLVPHPAARSVRPLLDVVARRVGRSRWGRPPAAELIQPPPSPRRKRGPTRTSVRVRGGSRGRVTSHGCPSAARDAELGARTNVFGTMTNQHRTAPLKVYNSKRRRARVGVGTLGDSAPWSRSSG